MKKKAIKDNKQYVNAKFNGVWKRHIDCDDEFKENYDKCLVEMLENDALEKFYKSNDEDVVNLRNIFTNGEIVEWVKSYVTKERIFYDSLMNEQTFTFKSIEKTRNEILELCKSDKFYKFLELGMKCRDIHRRIQYGLDNNSKPFIVPEPNKIVKLDDIRKKLIEDDEIILNE